MRHIEVRICNTVEEAASLADDLKTDADDEGRGLWCVGVTYLEDHGVEKTLFVALDHDGTMGGAVTAVLRLIRSLATLRSSVDVLMERLGAESFIDAETLELLTAHEIEELLPDEKEGNPTE